MRSELDIKLIKGSWTSLIIGSIIGLGFVFVFVATPLFLIEEPLGPYVFLLTYLYPIIGLLISLMPALWFAGRQNAKDCLNNKNILLTSMRYSIFVNAIIWIVFLLVSIFNHIGINNSEFDVYISIFFFIFCSIATTLTIGLMITVIIKKRIFSV